MESLVQQIATGVPGRKTGPVDALRCNLGIPRPVFFPCQLGGLRRPQGGGGLLAQIPVLSSLISLAEPCSLSAGHSEPRLLSSGKPVCAH